TTPRHRHEGELTMPEGTMTKTIIRGGVVVTGELDGQPIHAADVLIEGDRITAIGEGLAADGADVIDAQGCIVMPGLIDTHMHMWQHPWRQVVSRLWGFGDYAKVFWPIRETYQPQDTHDAVYGCALDMINHG